MGNHGLKFECTRCGELYYPADGHQYLQIDYKGLGDGNWHTIQLCPECEEELRAEFYRRRLTNDALGEGNR